MEGDIEELRRNPERVAGLGITEIVDHYDGIIKSMPRPPIIMGHSFGGLFTQILIDRGLGAAGVAIDSAPGERNPAAALLDAASLFPSAE